MTRTLLFEIGTEEIPSGFIIPALLFMEEFIKKGFSENRVEHGSIYTYGTPRRLAIMVEDVSETQQDKVKEVMGPPASVAFDQEGKPTKAALGFAKSQGVEVGDLKVKETPKGGYVYVVKEERGGETADLLPDILERLVRSIPFKKSMRWGDREIRFARPIHWFLALFGKETVNLEIEGIKSGPITYGHRFMAPHPIKLENPKDYLDALKEARVIADHRARRGLIWEQVQKEACSVGGFPQKDEELLDEVNFLVEYPVATCGSFDPEFLELPSEVLTTTMKEHQKYFPVFDEEGKLMNRFVVVNNMLCPDMGVITQGNERVLRARLADARFFFEEDRKVPLVDMLEKLRDVVFQEKLGTSYEKVMRFRQLAVFCAHKVAPEKRELVDCTALLAKADLESQMVYEFPELQGIMGREYAKIQGEPQEVSLGIYEHYLPRFAGDDLPSTVTGALVGIADRIDSIVGCFGIGLIPTGSEDPYGIRRDALGVIHVILHKGFRLSLGELIDKALELLKGKLEREPGQVKADVLGFLRQRLYHLWVSEGFRQDLTEAVLSAAFDDLVAARKRLEALTEFSQDPSFEALMTTFKRVVNILPKGFSHEEVDPALMEQEEEKALYQALLDLEGQVKGLVEKEDYLGALKTIATLKERVDAFFDGVLVMAKDENVKNNRLALLKRISNLFMGLADLSRVVLGK